jgi:hypothetical protein
MIQNRDSDYVAYGLDLVGGVPVSFTGIHLTTWMVVGNDQSDCTTDQCPLKDFSGMDWTAICSPQGYQRIAGYRSQASSMQFFLLGVEQVPIRPRHLIRRYKQFLPTTVFRRPRAIFPTNTAISTLALDFRSDEFF